MTQLLKDHFDELYKVSLTPTSGKLYYDIPDISNIIDHILKSNSRQIHYPLITDDEVKDLVDFLLKLVNSPTDLRGSLTIEPCIKYLTFQALKEIKASFGTIKIIMYIVRDWFDAIKSSPKAKKEYSKPPDIGSFPLFRFHLDAYKDSKINSKKFPSLYSAYGYQLHKAIRSNESAKRTSGFSDETYEAYVRSARFFFKYMPFEIKSLPFHPVNIPQDYIERFAKEYDISQNRNYTNSLTLSAKTYKERFERLIISAKIIPRTHSGHTVKKERINRESDERDDILKPMSVDGEIKILRPDDNLPITREYITQVFDDDDFLEANNEEIGCKGFESAIEFHTYTISEEGTEPVVSQKPSIRRGYEDIINLRNFHFYWDCNYLNLFHYSILYKSFYENLDKSFYYNSIIACLYILIHTGINSRRLLDLKAVEQVTDDIELPALFKKENRYYLLNQSPVQLKRPDSNSNCMNTSAIVYVPLPEQANHLTSKILTHKSNFVFSYLNENNNTVRLSIPDVEGFLEDKVNNSCPQYGLKISTSNISRSFVPLYHHRFGLDPIICCYISGEDYHRLFKSQMHYIHIKHIMIEIEYLRTFELVSSAIKKNLTDCQQKGFFTYNKTPPSDHAQMDKRINKRSSGSSLINFGYGSTIICEDRYITALIDKLKKAIINEKEFIKRHNLYTIYSYLCLQFNTGLRPRNNPDIIWDDYNTKTGVIAIQDKQSAKFHEKRFLPLAKTTRVLLENMKGGFKDIQRYLVIYKNPSAIRYKQSKIFFFIDTQTGELKDFTLKKMREHINETGFDFQLPLNMPRHYMRNHLYHSQVSNDIADVWMGHQHSGKEILNIASSAYYGESIRKCLYLIESMIEMLGFIEIHYAIR